MTTQLAIIKPENITTIVQAAPQSYNDNRASHDRCLSACQQLLDTIRQNGMNDELDQKAASFIEKSRRTVKAMNERRSPVTKLFDEVRSAFTAIENDIDPSKLDTIPYQLQLLRNQYAAQKRAEAEARKRAEAERQRIAAARAKYSSDVEQDLKIKYEAFASGFISTLNRLDADITLDNFVESEAHIKAVDCNLPQEFTATLRTTIPLPCGITPQEAAAIEQQVRQTLVPKLQQQFTFDATSNRDYILDRLPSKRRELQSIAQANEQEAARLKAEKEARESAEAAKRAEAEQQKQLEQQKQAEQQKQQLEMQSLFAGQATLQGYTPKTKVTKRINLLNPEGILPIISMWFTNEGCRMTVDDLAKKFKFAITYCEKLANKEGTTIQNESIEYIDEVKAK